MLQGRIDAPPLLLQWQEAPWDTAIYGTPVLQVTELEVRGPAHVDDAQAFVEARDQSGSALVSCRLPAPSLRESMFLEDLGFRFIEMVFTPELEVERFPATRQHGLSAALAEARDVAEIRRIAGSAFRNERFHVDPRLDPGLGDLRYQNWASSALEHPKQRLYVLRDGAEVVAFFVTELLADGTAYWHLNAVAPQSQGQGYGRRAWLAMMDEARRGGARRVRSSIVARNHRVLNLYASLGFRFLPPTMTFHWVRHGA
jgi:RimJ/RimL family protein N-acetyltransferase